MNLLLLLLLALPFACLAVLSLVAFLGVTNCRGDEDIDAKRSRPSIGPRCAEVPGRKSPI